MNALFFIWCRKCGQETKAAKVHSPKLGWCNRCDECQTLFPALPPLSRRVRQQRRMYERRSGQLLLGGGF